MASNLSNLPCFEALGVMFCPDFCSDFCPVFGERPPGLIQHMLSVLFFWSWVLLQPRLPASSRSLTLFPCASILLHGHLDMCLDLLSVTPLDRGRKRHINIWHINNFSVTPVTDPTGRVPDSSRPGTRTKTFMFLGFRTQHINF